jgi:cytoskeleton-associated protein 5
MERPALRPLNGDQGHYRAQQDRYQGSEEREEGEVPQQDADDGAISLTISKILSSDPSRSVDALKEVQRVLEIGPDEGPSSLRYRELSDHTEGLMETITLQINHVFENAQSLDEPDTFRVAKHLIHTINAFCDHPLLAESLQVEILTSLFEELTLRLLQTDESPSSKVKDLSKFINMIILRLFASSRKMTVLR